MKTILKNFRTTLRRFPTAVLLNVTGLAVAFAAFVVILMQVSREYGFNSHIPRAEQVFRVEKGYNGGDFSTVFNQPLIDRLTTCSAHIAAGSLMGENWWTSGDLRVERPNGTKEYFQAKLSVITPPMVEILGMEFIEGDTTALLHKTEAIIPQSMAEKLFPGERASGKKLFNGDGEITVTGVYRDFPAPSLFPNIILQGHPWMNDKGNNNYMYFVRLDDSAAAADVAEAMNRSIREFYAEDTSESGIEVRLVNVRDLYFDADVSYEYLSPKGNRTTTDILLAIAMLVIVIAAINFVNFASALTPMRMKMVNLQKILGAGVWQLRASLLFEAVVIALTAYLAAVLLVGVLAGSWLNQYVTADMSLSANVPLLGWCALVALGVGLLAGLYPAFYMTSFRPILAIKGSFGTSATGRRYRMALVGLQYVISLALIIATLFVNLQNRYLTHLDMGYDKDQVLMVRLPDDAERKRDVLTAQLKTFAGIDGVAYAYQSFGAAESSYQGWGRSFKAFEDGISFKVAIVTDDFLRVLGIPVGEGRDFSPADTQREPCAYIFNRTAQAKYDMQPGDYVSQDDVNAEGRHFPGWGEIVGFLPDDVRIYSQHMDAEPFCFITMGTMGGWTMNYCYVRVKAGSDMLAAADHIRRTVAALTPYDFDIEFMDSVVNSLYAADRKAGVLVSLFSTLAILVSLMGVFGLVLFETQYRRKEIGIRKVSGATSASILAMFNRRFAVIVCVSFLIAAPLAWYGVSEWLRSFRSAVPLAAWVFAAALLIVLTITVLTVTFRSWRTANENPIKSIKTE